LARWSYAHLQIDLFDQADVEQLSVDMTRGAEVATLPGAKATAAVARSGRDELVTEGENADEKRTGSD
jgi:hypothetical protein